MTDPADHWRAEEPVGTDTLDPWRAEEPVGTDPADHWRVEWPVVTDPAYLWRGVGKDAAGPCLSLPRLNIIDGMHAERSMGLLIAILY